MKNKKLLQLILFVFIVFSSAIAQTNYKQYIKQYQQEYVAKHEVVVGDDKQFFSFFKADENFKTNSTVTLLSDTIGFIMKTSGTKDKKFYRYAILNFKLYKKPFRLTLYSNKIIKDSSQTNAYLFLPFTDNTCGNESYSGGRYLDFELADIKQNNLSLDFNKAYNPYCVYALGYNCPIPLRENHLQINIRAGEKMFKGKKKK